MSSEPEQPQGASSTLPYVNRTIPLQVCGESFEISVVAQHSRGSTAVKKEF